MKTSPTQRSLKKMRKDGWLCAVTEKWNPYAKVRQDLFGFIDVLCVRPDEMVAVQTTSGDNVSARLAKLRSLPTVALWLSSPTRTIQVHGWAKRGGRGERKLWSCRVVDCTLLSLGLAGECDGPWGWDEPTPEQPTERVLKFNGGIA